jgi:hypothetical protein
MDGELHFVTFHNARQLGGKTHALGIESAEYTLAHALLLIILLLILNVECLLRPSIISMIPNMESEEIMSSAYVLSWQICVLFIVLLMIRALLCQDDNKENRFSFYKYCL